MDEQKLCVASFFMPVHLTEMSLHVWAMKQASHSHFSLTLLRFIYLFSISLTLFSVCNVTLMHVIKYKKTNKENRQMIKADVEKGCYALDQELQLVIAMGTVLVGHHERRWVHFGGQGQRLNSSLCFQAEK